MLTLYKITSRISGMDESNKIFVEIFFFNPNKTKREDKSPPKYIPTHLEQTKVL
jgi:hypothetical protein